MSCLLFFFIKPAPSCSHSLLAAVFLYLSQLNFCYLLLLFTCRRLGDPVWDCYFKFRKTLQHPRPPHNCVTVHHNVPLLTSPYANFVDIAQILIGIFDATCQIFCFEFELLRKARWLLSLKPCLIVEDKYLLTRDTLESEHAPAQQMCH